MHKPVEGTSRLSGNNRICLRLLIADDQPRVRKSLEALLTALCWNPSSRTARHLSDGPGAPLVQGRDREPHRFRNSDATVALSQYATIRKGAG